MLKRIFVVVFLVFLLSSCTDDRGQVPAQIDSSPEGTFLNLSVQNVFCLDSSGKIASEYIEEKGGLFSNSSIIGWGKNGKNEAVVFYRYDSLKNAFVCKWFHTEYTDCKCFKKWKKEIMDFLKQKSTNEKGLQKALFQLLIKYLTRYCV